MRLFWKWMPARHFITKEESMMSHIRLTAARKKYGEWLQITIEASLSCRKHKSLQKKQHFRSLENTIKFRCGFHIIFLYWKLKKYYKNNEILFNVLLLIDNVASYPTLFKHYHSNGKMIMLSPNTTSLLYPMNQNIMATFKAYRLHNTIEKLIGSRWAVNSRISTS